MVIINTTLDLFKYGSPPKKDKLTDKEFKDYLIKSPTKKQHSEAFSMGRAMLTVPEAEKNRMAQQWMEGGGRNPKGRSLDEEIKLGKEEWLKKQKADKKLIKWALEESPIPIAKKPKPKPVLPEWDWREGVWFDLQDVDPYYDWKPKPPEEETKIPKRPKEKERFGLAYLLQA